MDPRWWESSKGSGGARGGVQAWGQGEDCLPFLGDWVFPVPKPSTLGLATEAKEGGAQGDLTLSELPAQMWAHGGHGTHLGRIDNGRW